MADPPDDYRETLRVPAAWWVVGAVLALAVWWVFFVATPGPVAVVAAAVAAAAVLAALLRYGTVRVAVDASGFHAGRALLAWPYVGPVEPLDSAETRLAIGTEADARAFLVLRSYCRGAVRVTVDDERDPAPYWLVSTRHPAELAARLSAQRVQD